MDALEEVKVTTHREGDGWGVSTFRGFDAVTLPAFHSQVLCRSAATMLKVAYISDGQMPADSEQALALGLDYGSTLAQGVAQRITDLGADASREQDTAREALHIAGKLFDIAGRILATGIVSDDDRAAVLKASYV